MQVEISTGIVSVKPPLMAHRRRYRDALREVLKKDAESQEQQLAKLDFDDVLLEISQELCLNLESMTSEDINTIMNVVGESINGIRQKDFTPASSKQ